MTVSAPALGLDRSGQVYATTRASDAGSTLASEQGSSFGTRLYRHISDHLAGRGYLSREMYAAINDKDKMTSNLLSGLDPGTSLLYDSYMTAGFSYSNKARFVTAVNETATNVGQIVSIAA